MIAAFALLVQEATKLTLGQDLTVKVPHEVNKVTPQMAVNISDYSIPLNTTDFYVRTPMSLSSLVSQEVGPHMIAKKS